MFSHVYKACGLSWPIEVKDHSIRSAASSHALSVYLCGVSLGLSAHFNHILSSVHLLDLPVFISLNKSQFMLYQFSQMFSL